MLPGDSGIDFETIQKERAVAEKTIEQVQATYTEEWMKLPGVEGTGIGRCKGKPCIKVFSSLAVEALQDRIPSVVDGYPVTIEVSGTISATE